MPRDGARMGDTGAVGNGNEGSSPGGGSGGRGEGFGPAEGLLNGRGEGIRSLRAAGSPKGLLTGAGQRQKVTGEPRQSRAQPWRQRALGGQSAGGPGQRHSPALLSYGPFLRSQEIIGGGKMGG